MSNNIFSRKIANAQHVKMQSMPRPNSNFDQQTNSEYQEVCGGKERMSHKPILNIVGSESMVKQNELNQDNDSALNFGSIKSMKIIESIQGLFSKQTKKSRDKKMINCNMSSKSVESPFKKARQRRNQAMSVKSG